MMTTSIVYLVAGISSRFGGKIKQFAKVGPNDETLIEYSMNQAIEAGFDEIIFIVGNLTEKPFKERFGDEYKGIKIKYTLQKFDPETRDKPWGATDALLTTKDVCNNSFLVLNGDDIYGLEAFKTAYKHLQEHPLDCATVGYKLSEVLPESGEVTRGIFDVDENNYVKKIVETFKISKENFKEKNLKEDDLCSMNFYVLPHSVFDLLETISLNFKEEHKGDRKAESPIPTDLNTLVQEGKIRVKLYLTKEKWLGITNPGDEDDVRAEIAKLHQ